MFGLDKIDEGVIIINSFGEIVMINICAKLMFDINQDQIIGWKITDLFRKNEKLIDRKSVV